ncbi:MAG: ribonuclease HII [Spirochaetales bacterium]|nr:ribonuclease HII [Spirochaetales bacterium]MCF7937446.1 ribonuclease HII [Spirochaetales bacterium]
MICGIDEAGRGPLAGPVCAAVVGCNSPDLPEGLDDSKRLSPKKRESFALSIMNSKCRWGIGWASAAEIDRLNIHYATLLAMQRAFSRLHSRFPADFEEVVVDGKFVPDLPISSRAVIGGDGTIPQIMAASVLAKVARDRWMERFSWIYPEYDFERHKGYPTKDHRRSILLNGPSPIHRLTFRLTADQ